MKQEYYDLLELVKELWNLIIKYIVILFGTGMILITVMGKTTPFIAWVWLLLSIAVVFFLFFLINKGIIKHGLEGDV